MFLGIVAASLGLFTYVATFILPFVYLFMLTVNLYSRRILKNNIKTLFFSTISFAPAVIVLVLMILNQAENFTTGYVGMKFFPIFQEDIREAIGQFIKNIVRTIFMLHLEGDVVFRWNVPKSPHLDLISSVLFLIGLLYCWRNERKKFFFILTPLILLTLPSLSPALPPVEIPSSIRTIGIIPFIYILVALGLWGLFAFLSRRFSKTIGYTILIILIIMITYLNLYKYFIIYPQHLPNKNTPFGKIIASYIDTLPLDTKVWLTACCWGEWGQPEPKAIYYVLKHKKGRKNIVDKPFIGLCEELPGEIKNTTIILDPLDKEKIELFRHCFPQGIYYEHEVDGQKVFASLFIK